MTPLPGYYRDRWGRVTPCERIAAHKDRATVRLPGKGLLDVPADRFTESPPAQGVAGLAIVVIILALLALIPRA